MVWYGEISGHLEFKYPQKSWKNRKQRKILNAMHSDMKKNNQRVKRELKGQERNTDANILVEMEKWGQMRWKCEEA